MTPRESFIAALERRPPVGRVPHFELEFFLTMEAFGRVHASQRAYGQWAQMSETERELHRRDVADLQGGVDLAEVKRRVGDKVCLIGNVSCALLQTGTDAEVDADVRRALHDGMPGGGYVFATSNCIYTGMELRRYEQMLAIWRKEGVYPVKE